MQIAPGILAIGTALLVKKDKALILSDLHLGYEDAANRQGVMLPRVQFKELMIALERILESAGEVKQVILNGDLKHDFGRISGQEWRDALRLFDFLATKVERITVVKGNHDAILAPIVRKRGIDLVPDARLGSVLVLHGDTVPKQMPKEVKTIIIGHEHTAISVREGKRTETFKCFLKGGWRGKTLITMPSSNPLLEGTDVLRDQTLSPFLKGSLEDFEVFIAADETYYFGTVKDQR